MMKDIPKGIDFFGYRISDTTTHQEIEEIAGKLRERLDFSHQAIVSSIYSELRTQKLFEK